MPAAARPHRDDGTTIVKFRVQPQLLRSCGAVDVSVAVRLYKSNASISDERGNEGRSTRNPDRLFDHRDDIGHVRYAIQHCVTDDIGGALLTFRTFSIDIHGDDTTVADGGRGSPCSEHDE
jgi:hypothetical protein